MEKSKEEKLALLEETVAYYTEDVNRRCVVNDKQCAYAGSTLDKDSDGCAIGRLLDNETKLYLDRCHSNRGVDQVWEHIPENVKVYGKELLIQLQQLHDYPAHWDDKGLTIEGKRQYDIIKTRINIGSY